MCRILKKKGWLRVKTLFVKHLIVHAVQAMFGRLKRCKNIVELFDVQCFAMRSNAKSQILLESYNEL